MPYPNQQLLDGKIRSGIKSRGHGMIYQYGTESKRNG
jgi:hypothetical protein